MVEHNQSERGGRLILGLVTLLLFTVILGYDLLNEPIPNEHRQLNARLEPVYKQIASAIRQVDVNHVLFLSGAQWGSNFQVFRDVHFDRKLAYTFHIYWTEPDEQSFASALAFSQRHQVPLFLGESGENTDEWIRKFRTALDKSEIGWAFWTYKRLDTTRSMRAYRRPEYWNEIVAYEEGFDLPASERRMAIPSLKHSRIALRGLLRNIRFANTQENPGFLEALGLRSRERGVPTGSQKFNASGTSECFRKGGKRFWDKTKSVPARWPWQTRSFATGARP